LSVIDMLTAHAELHL